MNLHDAKVMVVGMGGLGCPAALVLARAKVGSLTLVDSDCVELSNLPRQLWHRPSDLGRPKVDSASERLEAAFPKLHLQTRALRLDAVNAPELFSQHDLVIDATDGAATKFVLSDVSVATGTALVYSGALGFFGQVLLVRPGGPCLRCLFEKAPAREGPTCAQTGVLGPLVGAVGALAAQVGLHFLQQGPRRGDTELLRMVEGRAFVARQISVTRRTDCACWHALGKENWREPAICPS
jgi:molybdopterin/thiamine biosynthesis adenylyltransferase